MGWRKGVPSGRWDGFAGKFDLFGNGKEKKMEMYMSMASLILGLAQIPFLMLLFRRARRLGAGMVLSGLAAGAAAAGRGGIVCDRYEGGTGAAAGPAGGSL